MKYVAVGGTFDQFHKGHEKLLNEAFKTGDNVLIGVTSDEFGGKKGSIDPYGKRISRLEEFLQKFNSGYVIKKLEDPYGPTIYDSKIDAIVVSIETKPAADKINNIRQGKGMDPLKIFVIDWILADDDRPIFSTRIRKGEIDRNGRILKNSSNL